MRARRSLTTSTDLMAAATGGGARPIPTIPATVPPIIVASSTTTGWTRNAEPFGQLGCGQIHHCQKTSYLGSVVTRVNKRAKACDVHAGEFSHYLQNVSTSNDQPQRVSACRQTQSNGAANVQHRFS